MSCADNARLIVVLKRHHNLAYQLQLRACNASRLKQMPDELHIYISKALGRPDPHVYDTRVIMDTCGITALLCNAMAEPMQRWCRAR